MTTSLELEYTPVPERMGGGAQLQDPAKVALLHERIARLQDTPEPVPNDDGEVELLGEVPATHRFVDAPGDSELVRWHLVEAGAGEPIVFLHGAPESWWEWHHQMEALAPTHRTIAVDLKGYGQSDKRTGDYRQEGVAEQLLALLDELGLEEFNLVTHDRGTVVADYLAAAVPQRVLRYARGTQHLWHFNPALAPQERLIVDPATAQLLNNRMTPVSSYTNLCHYDIAESDMRRAIQEWSFPGIGWAVPRYFNSSSFRKEWIDRRCRLIDRWTFPVLVLQGEHDHMQPWEFYVDAPEHLPDARVEVLDAGHFWAFENPSGTTEALRRFLA